MKDLPLNALRAFAAVYEFGGVRPAARVLDVAHSSISRHLRELEIWLGAPLFETQGRVLTYTAHGHALGRSTAKGFAELARAVETVREMRRANAVVVATTASFAVRWLLPRLPKLAMDHNWIEVSVVTEDAVRSPEDQRADVAIRMGHGPWTDGPSQPFMDEELFPVASESYWRTLRESDPHRALIKARLLHDRDPATAWEKWFASHDAANADLRRGSRFTSSDLVLRAAAEGLGVALARGRFARDDVANGALMRPFGELSLALPSAYWLVRSNETSRPAVETFIEWMMGQGRSS